MSATVIQPKQWRISNVDNVSTITKTDEIITLDSVATTSQYMICELPTQLPTQTKIRFSAEVRYISGEEPRAAIEFNANSQHDGAKRFEKYTSVPMSGDWCEVEVVELVKPGFRYVRLIFGYFQGTSTGKVELRNARLEISAGADDVFPILQEPVTYSKAWDADALAKVGKLSESGAGTMTLNSGELEGNTPDSSSKAYVVLGAEVTSRTLHHKGAKFIRLQCDAKKISGTCGLTVEFLSTYGSNSVTQIRKAEFISLDFEDNVAIFAVPRGTEVIRVVCGAVTGERAQFSIRSLKIDIFGGEVTSVATPLMASVKKDASAWVLDDAQGRFSNLGFSGISSNAAGVYLTYEGSDYRPIFKVETMSFSNGANYIAKVRSVTATTVMIELFEVSNPTVVVDPSRVSDDTVVQVIGLGAV